MVSVSNAGRRRRSRLRRRLAQAGTLTARTLRRLAKFLRVPPGIAAKREFGRQGRDFLQIAERVSTAPAAVLAIICRGRAEAMERLLKAVERHTIGPYELLFVAAEDAGPDLRILLTRYGLRGNAKIVWSGSAEGSAADIVAACSVHAPGADLVVLGSTAQLGPLWLQKLRLKAYLDENFQGVSTFDERACLYLRRDLIDKSNPALPADSALSSAKMRLADGQARRALFVVSTQTGGTPQTNQDLMQALAGRYEPYLLRCDSKGVSLLRWRGTEAELLHHVRLPKAIQPFPHVDDNYDRVVAGWLAEYGFDIVHIRHLVWHSLSLPRLAKAFGIPVVFSFHDFYTICPTIRLVDENDVFCGGVCTATPGQCKHELWKTRRFPPLKHAAVHRWREAMAPMLENCDAFVTTSASARDLVQRFFPVTRQRPFHIIEHGRDFPGFTRLGCFPEPGGNVRVLVPGNISATKGAHVLDRLQDLNADGRFEFHLMGHYARELEDTPNVVLHGPYGRDDFAARVNAIAPHFGVVLSIWPETFCHTLTEMWAAGLPVAGYDLGAVGERIRRHGGGWLIDNVSPEATFAALQAIAADRDGFAARLAQVAAWQEGPGARESCAWMADAYDELYSGLLVRPDPPAAPTTRAGIAELDRA